MKILAFFFCFLIGDQAWQLRAQEASGVFAPSLLDYFAAPYPLDFQVQFETPFESIPTVATTPRAVIQATTNGFYAQIYDSIIEHPMNAGLREAAGVQWVNGQSFALIEERPAFAFGPSIYEDGGINFARNNAADGMGKWDVETVIPSGTPDRWIDGITLLPHQNAPLIVFSQSDPDPASTNNGRIQSIKFAIASDDEGHGPWRVAPSGLESVKYGLLSNFELASNRVMVAFLDEKMTSLYVAAAPAALGGSAWDVAQIVTSPSHLSGISIAVINGKLMMSYAAERSDGGADLYLAEPADSVEQGWKTARIQTIPMLHGPDPGNSVSVSSSYGLGTELFEYGGQIVASYSYEVVVSAPDLPGWVIPIFRVFVSPAEGTNREWRQFSSSANQLFGRWSTLEGKPVKPIKATGGGFGGSELGLWIPPEVHWRATPGPQLSIARGTPRYSRDLGGTYDPKVVNASPGEFPEKVSFAATDLNGDKIPDLIVLGWVTNSAAVSVLLGDGSGSFKIHEGSPILLSAVARSAVPVGIQTGDLNGDGKMDVVVALGGLADGTLFRVLLGDGTGALREPLDASGAPASYLAKGLQGYSPAFALQPLKDGDRDEIIMHTTSGPYSYVQALRLDATAQLVSAPGFPIQLPYQPEGGIFAADFNTDGRMDVAMTSINAGGTSPPVTLLIQNPDGSFSTRTIGEKEENILNAFMADLNNDGNTDLLLVRDAGGLSTFLGDGLGNFERVDSNSEHGWPVAALPDLNGDGILDVFGGSFLQFGDGAGRFGTVQDMDPLPVFAADLNGDGRGDLVGFDEDSRIRVWLHPRSDTSTFDLSLTGVPGHEYELFWKQNLDSPEWVSIGRTSTDEYGQISTFHQTNSPSGFYRAVEVTALRQAPTRKK